MTITPITPVTLMTIKSLGFEKVEMTDHDFAKYLFGVDRNWYWVPQGHSTKFRDSNGKLLAVCIYDNEACTHATYLPKEKGEV